MQSYSVNQYLVYQILSDVQKGEIVIPEIQRPFVWDSTKVRDLMDSLYRGYPVGYVVAWKNPNVRLKDGRVSQWKSVLIDGQQRITALRAAILWEQIIDKEYRKKRIVIAFDPIDEKFETLTPAITNDPRWIRDISEALKTDVALLDAEDRYLDENPGAERRLIRERLRKLGEIKQTQIGYILLNADLDIETVTDIFIRINSQGVNLSQADFAMSKIASYGEFGVDLRKCVDYFCHLARFPKFYDQISEVDSAFKNTEYFGKISWLKDETDDLYDPDYTDVLRVAFTKEFERGKMSELVSLLSGRNFETRTYEDSVVEDSYRRLRNGVLAFVNETDFKRFLMIIKDGTGFVTKDLIKSQNVLNFAYILYLKLREYGEKPEDIAKYVKKWFVMSILTARYSGSPESNFDFDIKNIAKHGIARHLEETERSKLSEGFWQFELVGALDKAVVTSPYLALFFASQAKANDKGFLSRDITVRWMLELRGDIHHIFPKEFLKTKYDSRNDYNQIANMTYLQQEINIRIWKKAPSEYFREVLAQCDGWPLAYGEIDDMGELLENLRQNCIPESVFTMGIEDYPAFLEERKRLMAKKIEKYYKAL